MNENELDIGVEKALSLLSEHCVVILIEGDGSLLLVLNQPENYSAEQVDLYQKFLMIADRPSIMLRAVMFVESLFNLLSDKIRDLFTNSTIED